MNKKLYIKHFCHIKNNEVNLDGKFIFKDETTTNTKDFFKNIYTNQTLKYPKFFKMDLLSKLSFLAAELVLNNVETTKNIALVFSNNASSLDTDRKYQKSIDNKDDFYPSPAIFVYTLPNIGIGEISIRHQIKSENAFFVFQDYQADFHHAYENNLIQSQKSEAVLGGWVNVDKNSYEAFVYLVDKSGKIEHTKEQLDKLYNTLKWKN